MAHLLHASPRPSTVSKLLARASEGRTPTFVTAGAFALIVVVGVIDYFTGFQTSFAPIYMLPVAVIAWFRGRTTGLVAAFAAGAVQFVFDLAAAGSIRFLAGIAWNTLSVVFLASFMALTLALLHDVLDQESNLARTDPITEVNNARGFGEQLAAEMARSRRYGRPFSVAYIDLDDFKQVNDRLGHETGDSLLRLVGSTIRAAIRESDTVGRLGGDEYAVVFPETGAEAAIGVGEKLIGALTKLSDSGDWRISASVGIVTYSVPPETSDEVLGRADDLMYQAKRAGKGRVIAATLGGDVEPVDPGRDDTSEG
jgi:diguanylate cyclase (GGDEF)-like protein